MGSAEREEQIISSWRSNTLPWIAAVRQGQIQSRVEVTNQAILNAIRAQSPRSVLDLGCGEGWLCRALAGEGIDVLGIDAVEELLESARQDGMGRYQLLNYQDLSPRSVPERFDLIVCNFSLFGKESVEYIFSQAPLLLNCNGGLLVQTLHPMQVNGRQRNLDGWQTGSWQGFSSEFRNPAPWYYRTLDSWRDLFEGNGLQLVHSEEPTSPISKQPVSLILLGRKNKSSHMAELPEETGN